MQSQELIACESQHTCSGPRLRISQGISSPSLFLKMWQIALIEDTLPPPCPPWAQKVKECLTISCAVLLKLGLWCKDMSHGFQCWIKNYKQVGLLSIHMPCWYLYVRLSVPVRIYILLLLMVIWLLWVLSLRMVLILTIYQHQVTTDCGIRCMLHVPTIDLKLWQRFLQTRRPMFWLSIGKNTLLFTMHAFMVTLIVLKHSSQVWRLFMVSACELSLFIWWQIGRRRKLDILQEGGRPGACALQNV